MRRHQPPFFMEKIFIIGFMGCGKTLFGNYLAERLNLPFYDLDKIIESQTESTISQIFEEKGESFFRQQESDLLFNWQKSGIISCGGGILEFRKNKEFLRKQNAIILWLDSDFSLLYKRIKNSERPIVKMLSKPELHLLWEERKKDYQSLAHFTIKNLSSENLRKNSQDFQFYLANRKK
jgi:shikimate kinase